MIYLKEFNTQAEYAAAVDAGEIKAPSVSLINDPYTLQYKSFVPYGFYIQHIDGTLYTEDQWAASGLSGDLTNGIAVVHENASFVVAKVDAGNSRWGGSGQIGGLPYYNAKAEALTDYNGKNNTTILIGVLTEGAALSCANYIFPNKQAGYLPAIGEWDIVVGNFSTINRLLTLAGGEKLIEDDRGYWSSTQNDSTTSWKYRTVYARNAETMTRSSTLHIRAFATL